MKGEQGVQQFCLAPLRGAPCLEEITNAESLALTPSETFFFAIQTLTGMINWRQGLL
jgi:hypothetical protein